MVVSFYERFTGVLLSLPKKLFYLFLVLFLPKSDCCYIKIAKFSD